MKFTVLFSLAIIFYFPAFCQKTFLFESSEYKAAYDAGTRSRTGMPGGSYWQNHSEYEIKATFDPSTMLISGELSVKYFNESPDSLNSVIFKLMQNVYKKGAVRQMAVDTRVLHDGIKIQNVKFNDILVEEKSINESGTVMRVGLPTYIKENSNAIISMNFETPMPKSSGFRSGTVDSSSFFMAYWFPQVAVYDDTFGWDTDEYVGIPENYNDFSNYKVAITLPSQYNVWATGKHMNMEEIFSDEILARIEESKVSKIPVKIIDESDFRLKNDETTTWIFEANNVPDFAWGASDHYVWEGMAARNPNPSNLCWVQTAYPIGAANFDWVLGVAKNSVELFSLGFPAVPYPYFKHISFRGTQGGGMEFPMLANNDATPDTVSTIMVTAHELAHNYFPFMMGINERKYGWWDETMTTLMESYLSEKAYPDKKVQGMFNRKFSFPYLSTMHSILPLMTETSSMMKVMPTIVNFYVKGPAIMDGLENLLGTKTFYGHVKSFMYTWEGKHPTPYDFYYYVNSQEKENLNWFWNACFFSQGYPDLGVKNATQSENYLSVSIQNVGGLPEPFQLTVTYENGESFDEEYNIKIWKENLENCVVRIPVSGKVEKVNLNQNYFYDADPANNEQFIIR